MTTTIHRADETFRNVLIHSVLTEGLWGAGGNEYRRGKVVGMLTALGYHVLAGEWEQAIYAYDMACQNEEANGKKVRHEFMGLVSDDRTPSYERMVQKRLELGAIDHMIEKIGLDHKVGF